MPIYEYKCNECGQEFEELVLSSGAENPPCPKCKSKDTEKQLSTFSAGSSGSGPGEMPAMPPAAGCGSSGFG